VGVEGDLKPPERLVTRSRAAVPRIGRKADVTASSSSNMSMGD
jgi:hypothetical protein